MRLTTEQLHSLDVGLNEAALLGVEVDPDRRVAAATFNVLTLPEAGPAPEDRRVQFTFWPVGRLLASFRLGPWNDPKAEVVPFNLTDLPSIVQSFGGLDLFGWEFFDVVVVHKPDRWQNRVSLDYSTGDAGRTHTLDLFQDASDRYLDMRLWFDELIIHDPAGKEIDWQEFAAGGKRWWEGLRRGDERTNGFGIFPLK